MDPTASANFQPNQDAEEQPLTDKLGSLTSTFHGPLSNPSNIHPLTICDFDPFRLLRWGFTSHTKEMVWENDFFIVLTCKEQI